MKKILSVILSFIMLSFSTMPVFAQGINGTIDMEMLTENDFELSSEVTYVWDDSYAITIEIENKSEKNITDWQLASTINGEIVRIANARIESTSNNLYIFEPLPQISIIKPTETVEIGLVITGDPMYTIDIDLYGALDDTVFYQTTIDDSLPLYQSDDFYTVNDTIESISGIIDIQTDVYALAYIIQNEYGDVILSGKLPDSASWSIDNIGLDIGYNKLIIAGLSEGKSFASEVSIINFDLGNAEQLGIDFDTDTDGDLICDYLEERLELDPNDAYSISDSLSDYECVVNALGIDPSHETIDTSTLNLQEDMVEPQATSFSSLVIHRTYRPEGKADDYNEYSDTVAEDLTYNDLSYNELCELGNIFGVADTTTETAMWNEMALIFTAGKRPGASMNTVIDEMLELFRAGDYEGTSVEVYDDFVSSDYETYSNGILASAVVNHSSTEEYVDLIVEYVEEHLSSGESAYDLAYLISGRVRDENLIEEYVESFSPTPYPSYGGVSALGITVHGWHGHTIKLINYRETATGFTGSLSFHFYDHFGLDSDEEQLTWIGFCDWYTLQHYTRFNGKYAPFITQCDFTVPISGTFE